MGNTRSAWDERDDEIEVEGEGGGDDAAGDGHRVKVRIILYTPNGGRTREPSTSASLGCHLLSFRCSKKRFDISVDPPCTHRRHARGNGRRKEKEG